MDADESRSEIRRGRSVEQAALLPGPARDLQSAIYQLYAAADCPRLDDLARMIAVDDSLPGAPKKDLISKIVSGEGLASQQDTVTVAVALARADGRDDTDAVARQVRALWIAARSAPAPAPPTRLGRPIGVCDPLDLEVHPAIDVTYAHGNPLPGYVRRAHDARLREIADRMLNGGGSRLVTLVGGSSTGKTRACWELACDLDKEQPGQWRVWHPYDPTRPQAALADIERVGAHTVVWLNDAQHYLMPADSVEGERLAAGLRTLLQDPDRAPVLVLATLWPQFWGTLTVRPDTGEPDLYAQARELLDGTMVSVADTFTVDQVAALTAAGGDAQLRYAAEHAEGGRITQYLAGAPALEERYRAAPPAAKAILQVAIDARRLGYPLALPHALLEQAAPGYLDDQSWDSLGEDWLETALAYTAQPCEGARGPLTRIRARPGGPVLPGGPPRYRLADYLEQLGRTERAGVYPPASFWEAISAASADHDVLFAIGEQAHRRGRYRRAVLLYAEAATLGNDAADARLAFLRLQAIGVKRADHGSGSMTVVADAGYGDPTLFRIAAVTGTMEIGVDRKGKLPAALQTADDGDPSMLIDLAGRCWGAGEREGALDVVKLAAGRGAPGLLAQIADDMAERGDLAGARDLYQQAIDHGVLSALARIAALCERVGDHDQAQRLRRFGLNNDGSPATTLGLGS